MRQDIRLIVTDLDGTLLTKADRIHPENILALQRCRQKGIKVCPVTARNWREFLPVLRQMEFDEIAALNNGASMVGLPSGKIRENIVFSTEQLTGLVESILTMPISYLCVMGMEYNHCLEGKGAPAWFHFYTQEEKDRFGICPFADEKELLRESREAVRINCGLKKGHEQQLRKALAKLEDVYKCKTMFMEEETGNSIEISPERADKAHALEKLCRYFGVEENQVLAFGDNENDMEMLRRAGISVAMGNANRAVKNSATMVTDTNKQGGVAAALERLGL